MPFLPQPQKRGPHHPASIVKHRQAIRDEREDRIMAITLASAQKKKPGTVCSPFRAGVDDAAGAGVLVFLAA